MSLEKPSPCKVNLLLNILGKRVDGFHELETVMYPINVYDRLSFEKAPHAIALTCSDPALPTDSRNLVFRAAEKFLQAAQINEGVKIHLEKRIPLAAGLGGGSGNAATTLLGLNELFELPLASSGLQDIAASLGSDIPFFLQTKAALGIGRGEQVQSLDLFPALQNHAFILIHPGFGIATAWAYQQLQHFPEALNGRSGRARALVGLLQSSTLSAAAPEFYNSLEAPALHKFPILTLFQEFLRGNGAEVSLMSGSGSTTFGICQSRAGAEQLVEKFRTKFGANNWIAIVDA